MYQILDVPHFSTRQESAAAGLEREVLQVIDGAGKAGSEAERAQALRVIPAVGGELLEEIGLQLRRSHRRLAREGVHPGAGDAAVERTPEDPLGEGPRQ